MKRRISLWEWCVVFLILGINAQAALLDLTSLGASGTINGATFQQDLFELATGTGNFNSFVRIQAKQTESGYNTDGALEFDTKASIWTHSILLSQIPVVGDHYEVRLDINESDKRPYISLEALKIHLADSGDLTGYNTNPDFGPALYDLDAGGDNTVLLDYGLASGSGSGDMTMLIPVSVLGTDGSKYFYLYSEFSGTPGTSAGFEEWGVLESFQIPEPASLILLGTGCLLLRKRQ